MSPTMNRVLKIAVRTADHLVATSQPEAAATILENYLSRHGAEASVLRRLGRIRLAQGRSQEAVVLLERALVCHFETTTVAERAQSRPPSDSDTGEHARVASA